jgi:hypothetical protein
MWSRTAILAAVVFVGLAQSGSAKDLVIVESSAPEFKQGQVVDGGKSLTLGAGTRIVMIGDDGKVIKLDGPFKGVPDGSASASAGDPQVVAAISRLFNTQGAETSALGTFRSASPLEGGRAGDPPDAWSIDIARGETQCAESGVPPMLWRAEPGRDATVLVQRAGGVGGLVRFPAGIQSAAWPADVPLDDATEYLIRDSADAWSRSWTLHIVPASASSDISRVAWMADHGCTRQAKTLLTSLY